MKAIIEQYGKFIMTGTVLAAFWAVIFFGMTDENGNRGIMHVIGANFADIDIDYGAYSDYGTMMSEGQKQKPVITTVANTYMCAGIAYPVANLVKAADYAGHALPVTVDGIQNESGNDVMHIYQADTGKITFPDGGIYEFIVHAVDEGNRSTCVQLKIPVNKR